MCTDNHNKYCNIPRIVQFDFNMTLRYGFTPNSYILKPLVHIPLDIFLINNKKNTLNT